MKIPFAERGQTDPAVEQPPRHQTDQLQGRGDESHLEAGEGGIRLRQKHSQRPVSQRLRGPARPAIHTARPQGPEVPTFQSLWTLYYVLSHISYVTLFLPVHYSSKHQDGALSPDRGREHRRFGLPKCHPSGKHPGHNESHTQPLRLPEARRLGAGLHQLAEPRIPVASMTQSAQNWIGHVKVPFHSRTCWATTRRPTSTVWASASSR